MKMVRSEKEGLKLTQRKIQACVFCVLVLSLLAESPGAVILWPSSMSSQKVNESSSQTVLSSFQRQL